MMVKQQKAFDKENRLIFGATTNLGVAIVPNQFVWLDCLLQVLKTIENEEDESNLQDGAKKNAAICRCLGEGF